MEARWVHKRMRKDQKAQPACQSTKQKVICQREDSIFEAESIENLGYPTQGKVYKTGERKF